MANAHSLAKLIKLITERSGSQHSPRYVRSNWGTPAAFTALIRSKSSTFWRSLRRHCMTAGLRTAH